ncbi:archaeal proteasome endopeptidase complex subunit beta [Candidatus Micrarchaeota archaeon]|nr:archaeal proteasome endopeptidase complex subunit beta [Candidatus Micrarchaeota archaeon]
MEDQTYDKSVKTGTTTVGLVSAEGVVLASDRRATMGYLIASKDIDKIYPISDNIAMTVAGSVGDAQKLVRWMKAELKLYSLKEGKQITVEAAATLLANILSQYKFFPFFVQLLIGGTDRSGSHVYSVDMLGGVTEEKYTSTGSGSPIAYGVLEEMYKEDLNVDDTVRVAAKAVSAAMKRDAASGENVDVCVVDKRGFRRLDRDFVKKIIQ